MPLVQSAAGDAKEESYPHGDVVLAFPSKPTPLVRSLEDFVGQDSDLRLRPATDTERRVMEAWRSTWQQSVERLSRAGLTVLPFYSRDRDQVFLKLGADEQLLRTVAEANRYKLELRPEYACAFAEFQDDYSGRRDLNCTDQHFVSHLFKVQPDDDADIEDEDAAPQPQEMESATQQEQGRGTFFRTVDRIRLINDVIEGSSRAAMDIDAMLQSCELLDYLPLHEYRRVQELDGKWFGAFAWGTRTQLVRDYFGESVAMYFLFLAHMHRWLVFPSILGLLCWIFDGSASGQLELTFLFAIVVWLSLLTHFWRRTACIKAQLWGSLGCRSGSFPRSAHHREEKAVRPTAAVLELERQAQAQQHRKVIYSYLGVLATVGILICIFTFLLALPETLFPGHGNVGFLGFVCQLVNAIVVDFFDGALGNLARRLTDLEGHSLNLEYTRHLVIKLVALKSVNSYALLYIIAFFQESSSLRAQSPLCPSERCVDRVASQLAALLFVRVGFQLFLQVVLPMVVAWRASIKSGRDFLGGEPVLASEYAALPGLSKAERESAKQEHQLAETFDATLILFGYATLFAVAAPWAPCVVLVCSILQCLLEQKKMLLLYRRPFPRHAADNGPWDVAFDAMSGLAVLTNVALVAFSSSRALHDCFMAHRVLLFIILEHVAIALRGAFAWCLPAMPAEVVERRHRQDILVHQHLHLGGNQNQNPMADEETDGVADPISGLGGSPGSDDARSSAAVELDASPGAASATSYPILASPGDEDVEDYVPPAE